MARVKIRIVAIAACVWSNAGVLAVQAAEPSEVRVRAERSFDQFQQHQGPATSTETVGAVRTTTDIGKGLYHPPDEFLIGKGQGDLIKGAVVCQRVAELSARADLAKQIRVLVKERMVDRTRERTGKEAEQDIELTREEIVQEYLQGVKIVDHRIDEEHKTCTATAVMSRSQIQLKPEPATPDILPSVIR
jgi:hypothetical protein